MKKFILVCAVAFASVCTMAQKTTNQIILKNGSMIKGEIIEQVPGQNIKIKTADGSIFVYDMNDVEKITQVEKTSAGGNVLSENKHRGLDLSASIGPEFGLDKGGGTTFAADLEIGKKFSKSFYFGVGGGVRAASGTTTIPVFGTLRFFMPLQSTSITPTISLRGGYAISTEDSDWSCPFVEIMPGVQIPVSPAIDINIGLGYIGSFYDGRTTNALGVKLGVGVHKFTGITKEKKFRPTRDTGLQYEIGFGGGSNEKEVGEVNSNYNYKENIGGGGGEFAITYKWNPNISFGVGVGIGTFKQLYDHTDTYDNNSTKDSNLSTCDYSMDYTSFFLRGKYRFTTKRLSPFVAADLGIMSVSGVDEYKFHNTHILNPEEVVKKVGSMTFFTPAVGVSWRIAPNSYLEYKLGYRMTSASLGKIEKSAESSYKGPNKETYEGKGTSNISFALTFVHTTKLLQNLFK